MTRPSSPDPLAGLVERARDGDAAALDQLVRSVQDDVYGLAIRMLWDPHDAQDATQEILVKVVTRLDRFRGDSALRTWVYRVAVNHLLTARRRRVERRGWTFEAFAEDLATGLDIAAPAAASSPAEELLAEEVKVGCTLGMLQCLDRPQRIAYILGEVFGLPSETAALICATTPPPTANGCRAREAPCGPSSRSTAASSIPTPPAAAPGAPRPRCGSGASIPLHRPSSATPSSPPPPPSPQRSPRWKTSTTPPRCSAPTPTSPPPTPSGAPSPAPSAEPAPSWTTNHPCDHAFHR